MVVLALAWMVTGSGCSDSTGPEATPERWEAFSFEHQIVDSNFADSTGATVVKLAPQTIGVEGKIDRGTDCFALDAHVERLADSFWLHVYTDAEVGCAAPATWTYNAEIQQVPAGSYRLRVIHWYSDTVLNHWVRVPDSSG